MGVSTGMATFFGEKDPAKVGSAQVEAPEGGRGSRAGDPARAAARAQRIARRQARAGKGKRASKDDVVCEEALLEAFAR